MDKESVQIIPTDKELFLQLEEMMEKSHFSVPEEIREIGWFDFLSDEE